MYTFPQLTLKHGRGGRPKGRELPYFCVPPMGGVVIGMLRERRATEHGDLPNSETSPAPWTPLAKPGEEAGPLSRPSL